MLEFDLNDIVTLEQLENSGFKYTQDFGVFDIYEKGKVELHVNKEHGEYRIGAIITG